MPNEAINKKTEELKQIIKRLEQKIKEEELNPVPNRDAVMDRMTYLKRKLNIFNELLLKYTSPAT